MSRPRFSTGRSPDDESGNGTRSPSRWDVALAVGLAALIQVEYHIDYAGSADVTSRHVIIGLLLALPLVWRRTAPVPVGLTVVTVFSLQPELVVPTPNTAGAALCLVVAMGALALYPRTWAVAIISALAATAIGNLGAWLDPNPDGIEAVSTTLLLLGVWGAGALLRRQTERARRSEAAAVTERIAAEARARDLVAAERTRIARELHDVVSHGIGVIGLQARGGRRVLDSDAARARTAFDHIESASTQCLREMRLMLDVLRIQPGDPAAPPQPSLAALDDLVADLRSAGQRIHVEVQGDPVALPADVDLSAYRIVQEALSNVAHHAPGAAATVAVAYEPDMVTLEIVNDGPTAPDPLPGHGLVGIRERAQLYGGSAEWGSDSGSGFRVRARLLYGAGAS